MSCVHCKRLACNGDHSHDPPPELQRIIDSYPPCPGAILPYLDARQKIEAMAERIAKLQQERNALMGDTEAVHIGARCAIDALNQVDAIKADLAAAHANISQRESAMDNLREELKQANIRADAAHDRAERQLADLKAAFRIHTDYDAEAEVWVGVLNGGERISQGVTEFESCLAVLSAQQLHAQLDAANERTAELERIHDNTVDALRFTTEKYDTANERLRECREAISEWAREKLHGKMYGLLINSENKLLALAATEKEGKT